MFNMIIAGVGGQGSILASHIFADAAIRASVTNGDNDVKVKYNIVNEIKHSPSGKYMHTFSKIKNEGKIQMD